MTHEYEKSLSNKAYEKHRDPMNEQITKMKELSESLVE
jgi:hypothetical protein